MSVFFETLRIMGMGMTGIFISILLFYGLISTMIRIFPR